MKTNQEIFDACVTHVLKQGKPAKGRNGYCRFLTDMGLSCALGGPLVAAGLYDERMEDSSPILPYREIRPNALVLYRVLKNWGVSDEQFPLLVAIQDCHDMAADCPDFLYTFTGYSKEVATRYKLTYPSEL